MTNRERPYMPFSVCLVPHVTDVFRARGSRLVPSGWRSRHTDVAMLNRGSGVHVRDTGGTWTARVRTGVPTQGLVLPQRHRRRGREQFFARRTSREIEAGDHADRSPPEAAYGAP